MNKFLDDVLKPLIHDAITSVVSLLVPMITAEIIKQLGTRDEVLTAKQLHDKVFVCYKDIQTTRDNFLLRVVMALQGKKIADVCRDTRLSRPTVAAIYKDVDGKTSIQTCVKIADCLDVSLDEIFRGEYKHENRTKA